MGATLERMGGEEGIVPERSEWFRSRGIIGTGEGLHMEVVKAPLRNEKIVSFFAIFRAVQ